MISSKKVLWNAFSQIGGKILGALASLLIIKIITQFGTTFYGNYLTSYEFLAFFGIFADSGLFAIATRELSKNATPKNTPQTQSNFFGNILGIRLTLVVIMTILAGSFAQFTNYPDIVKTGIWITGISMGLTIFAGTLSATLQAKMKIHFFSIAFFLGKFVLLGLIFWKTNQVSFSPEVSDNFYNLLWLGVISNIIFAGLVFIFAQKNFTIKVLFQFKKWRQILRESLPFGLSLVLQTLYLRLDILLISFLLGASAVGVYGVSTRLLETLLVFGVFLGHAILPKISNEKNPTKKAESLSWGIAIATAFSLPMIIIGTIFSTEIISLVSAKDYLSHGNFFGSDSVLQILIFTVFFAYLNQIFTFSLVAKNQQKKLFIVNGIALLANAGLNLFFLSKYGIAAAALSTIFCEIIVFGLLAKMTFKNFFQAPHYTFSSIFPRRFWKPILLANSIIGAFVFLAPLKQNLIVSLIFIGIVYAIIFWRSKKDFIS